MAAKICNRTWLCLIKLKKFCEPDSIPKNFITNKTKLPCRRNDLLFIETQYSEFHPWALKTSRTLRKESLITKIFPRLRLERQVARPHKKWLSYRIRSRDPTRFWTTTLTIWKVSMPGWTRDCKSWDPPSPEDPIYLPRFATKYEKKLMIIKKKRKKHIIGYEKRCPRCCPSTPLSIKKNLILSPPKLEEM